MQKCVSLYLSWEGDIICQLKDYSTSLPRMKALLMCAGAEYGEEFQKNQDKSGGIFWFKKIFYEGTLITIKFDFR